VLDKNEIQRIIDLASAQRPDAKEALEKLGQQVYETNSSFALRAFVKFADKIAQSNDPEVTTKIKKMADNMGAFTPGRMMSLRLKTQLITFVVFGILAFLYIFVFKGRW
jgi:hypothetical protein